MDADSVRAPGWQAPPALTHRQLYWLVGALAAITLVLFLLVLNKMTTSRPDSVAAAYVAAANAKKVDTVNQLTCAAQQDNITFDPLSKAPQVLGVHLNELKAEMTLKGVAQRTDTRAVATVELNVTDLPVLSPTSNISATVALDMTRDSDGWKICGVHLGG